MARTVKNVTVVVTVVTAGTPVAISASSLFVPEFEAQPAVGNTGTYCYIGDSAVDNTYIARTKGSILNVTSGDANPNTAPMIDLSKWYVDSDTSGDKVVVQYRVLTED